jgi:hypothetical protein
MDDEDSISEKSRILEKLGKELAERQYDFKIKENKSEQYWGKRIEEFQKYHKKTSDYFMEAYALMNLIDKTQSPAFLLRISKLKQLGTKLLENMEKIRENPSIMNTKDHQQSKWSVEQKENLFTANEDCKNHEKHMNIFFREFYERSFKAKKD